jgi:signal peptidase I
VGRAFVVVWPPQHAAVLGVPSTFTTALAAPGAPLALGAIGALPVTLLRRRWRRRRASR